ncbi:hypothetical protein [Streptomyces sp. NPDC001970]
MRGIHDGGEEYPGVELVLVVVLGGIRPALARDIGGRVGDAGACPVPSVAQFQGGALSTGEEVGSRRIAIRRRPTELSPARAASLVCPSMDKSQPLMWLAPHFISSCVVFSGLKFDTTLPAESMCLWNVAAKELPK